MGWGGEEEYDVSKFNPAQHKMNRINELTRFINESKLSPESWNTEFNDWGYNVYFEATSALYDEVFVKFNEEEREECEILKKAIEDNQTKFPIQERNRKGKWTSINKERLKIFMKWMRKYEQIVRDKQDDHGLDTPNEIDNVGL